MKTKFILLFALLLSLQSLFAFLHDEESRKKLEFFRQFKVEENEKTKRVRELLRHMGNSELIDLSRKNGISDYDLYLQITPFMGQYRLYSSSNNIYVYKFDKLYSMPSSINTLLKDENIKVDSSNVFKCAKKMIRLSVTQPITFVDEYFISEEDNIKNKNYANPTVGIVTRTEEGEQKWELGVNYKKSGRFSHIAVIYQDILDNKGNKLRLGKAIHSYNYTPNNRPRDSELYWTNSIDQDCEDGSQIDLEDGFFNDEIIEGYQKDSFWQKRRSVIRKQNNVYINPEIKIVHDYPSFNFQIYYSYTGDGITFDLIKSGSTISDTTLFNIPETFLTSDTYYSIPSSLNGSTTTGIWRVRIERDSDIIDYYFNVFDVKTSSLDAYSDGLRVYYRENEDIAGSFTTEDITDQLITEVPQLNSYLVNQASFNPPANADTDTHFDIYLIDDRDYKSIANRITNEDEVANTENKYFKYIIFSPYKLKDMFIDGNTSTYFNGYGSTTNAVKSLIAHEFFHSVQVPYYNIFKNWHFGSEGFVNYILEGQAVAFQTIYRPEIEFVTNPFNISILFKNLSKKQT